MSVSHIYIFVFVLTHLLTEHETIFFFSFLRRQHRRPDRKLPRHAPHRLEGLPAPAVRPAGNRGVRRGGSCGFPEEAGAEQEVLLRRDKFGFCFVFSCAMNCFPVDRFSTFNVNLLFFFFSKDCTNVYIYKALRLGVNSRSF